MKHLIIFALLILQTCICIGQDMVFHKEYYHIVKELCDVDSVCVIKYVIENKTDETKVLLFTEDNVNEMPMDMLIRRKFFRRYGEFNLTCWIWENIVNESKYINFPGFFVKLIEPNKCFEIALFIKNEKDEIVDCYFRKHTLLCRVGEIDNEKMFSGFVWGLKNHKAEYPYSSITINWEDFKHIGR